MGAPIVNLATKISLAVQLITGIFGFYGLAIPLAAKDIILRQVLTLEMVVQVIEFIFYVGFLKIFNLTDLTRMRYYDWFMSTPTMLFTISLYFFYVNFIEGFTDAEKETGVGLEQFVQTNTKEIVAIVILNFLMLLFGFLAEIGMMDRWLAFALGTGGLLGSFGIIYEKYAKHSEKTRSIFWIMFGLWATYGIAFLLPPVVKNLSYTTLDIFAKNFFGIFLYFIIRSKAVVPVSNP